MNDNNRIDVAKEFGTDLSSRRAGAQLRRQTESLASRQVKAVVDLADVRTISHSFADEAFAVLIAKRGAEWFKVNVSIQGISDSVRETLLDAVAIREGGGPAVTN